jgi:hypothetical protein
MHVTWRAEIRSAIKFWLWNGLKCDCNIEETGKLYYIRRIGGKEIVRMKIEWKWIVSHCGLNLRVQLPGNQNTPIINLLFPYWKNKSILMRSHVRWVHFYQGMARPQVVDGGDGLQIWRVAANMLNKYYRIADKEWSSSLGVGRGANNFLP